MAGYLLDTNVLSEVIKPQPAPAVMRHLRETQSSELFTSTICVYELRYGVARSPNRDALWHRLKTQVLPLVQILPLHPAAALLAADLRDQLERQGQLTGLEDLLIGATALTHDLAVVTRNVRHLGRIDGLPVEDWWT